MRPHFSTWTILIPLLLSMSFPFSPVLLASTATPERSTQTNEKWVETINKGETAYRLGNYKEAEGWFKLSMAIGRLGPQDPRFAISCQRLGETLYKLKQYRNAELLFRDALSIRQTYIGTASQEVLETLTVYAQLLREIHEDTRAETLEQRAQLVKDRLDGRSPNTPLLAPLNPGRMDN